MKDLLLQMNWALKVSTVFGFIAAILWLTLFILPSDELLITVLSINCLQFIFGVWGYANNLNTQKEKNV